MWPIFVRTVGIDILPAPFVVTDGAAVAAASNVDNIWDFVTASCNSVLLASVDGWWYFISLWEFIHLIINIGILRTLHCNRRTSFCINLTKL